MRGTQLRCFAAGVLLAASAAAAPSANLPPPSAPVADAVDTVSVDEALLRRFEHLGRELYRADRAAWLTTDQLHEQGLVRPGDIEGVPDGWVTSPTVDPDVWRVAYVAVRDGKPMAFADGTVDFSGEPLASLRPNKPYRPLDPDESAQRAIRSHALEREWMSCSRSPYNTATVPNGHGGWNVYLMPPQTSATVFPMGGFHRFSYDAGGRFVEHYAHTRGCIDQDLADAPVDTVRALMITHVTSPTPNEIHVFMSLAYTLPVYVATSDRALWNVDAGRISRVQIDVP